MRRAIGALTVLAVAGCAIGPSTRVEPLAAPAITGGHVTSSASRQFLDSLRTERAGDRVDSARASLWKPVPLTVQTTRDLAWLEILQDSQLVAMVRTAVANNRDLRTAQARVREYRALRGVAASGFFPSITANGSGGRNKVVSPFAPAPIAYDAVTVTADLSWELDFWGRLRRQTQAANFDYQGREEDVRATTLTLISDVATAYLQLRELDENLRIAEQTLVSRRATLDLAKRRFAQGVISELDVRQFEAEVADPAARVADFARQRRQRENELSFLLGSAPMDIPRGEALTRTIQVVAVPDSIPGALISRRPDVLRAERDYQAATARIGVAIANRLPAVTLRGQYGSQRPKFEGLFTPSGEMYTMQAGISLPLFTGGRLLNTERAARARADQAKSQYEQTTLAALREASDALVTVQSSHDQLAAQETQANALRVAFSLAERRYASGVSSYLEVLDAQRGLFAAELALVQVQRQYLVSMVQLYKALGGSWTETGLPAR